MAQRSWEPDAWVIDRSIVIAARISRNALSLERLDAVAQIERLIDDASHWGLQETMQRLDTRR
jgi:hypothetical protein